MTVTHNGKLYHVAQMADRLHWRLTEIGAPRNSVTLNRDQMLIAGFGHIVEHKPTFKQFQLKAAQNKAVIARGIGDGAMWMSAYNDMKAAIGYPWHRRSHGMD